MTEEQRPRREAVPAELTWDLTLLYPNDAAMEADLKQISKRSSEVAKLAGTLTSAPGLLHALRAVRDLESDLEKAYVYAFLRRDSDTTDSAAATLYGKAAQAATTVATATAFLEPEVVAINDGDLKNWQDQEPGLAEFKYELATIKNQRDHVLTGGSERLLSRLNRSLDSAAEIYNTLNDADLRFGRIKNEAGKLVELTHGNRSQFTESADPAVRKAATLAYAKPYQELKNTFAQTLNSFVGSQNAVAELRHYQSARQAALLPHEIDEQVYDTLVATVGAHLNLAHRWYALKKRALKISDFTQADVTAPLADPGRFKTSFEAGKELTLDALKVLGPKYQEGLKHEFNERWIDAVETVGKRSGGYQISAYQANPFILLNWTDKLYSTFVLAHESGHAMHAWLSQQAQPAQYAEAPIFLAEVASTFNENILTAALLDRYQGDREATIVLLEQALDGFIGTIFRQTQFAEFEDQAYKAEQAGQTLTADFLDRTSTQLLKKYYGPTVRLLAGTATQSWAYVPHFYMDYYVYQYATSWAAATSLAAGVWNHEPGARDRYLGFLRAGGSDSPLKILKRAGVDATKKDYLVKAFKVMEGYLDQLERLI